MELFKKIKAGATKAADVAQQTVEVTKLVAQITGKRRELEKNNALIGHHVYESYKAGNVTLAEAKVKELCEWNTAVEREIAALELQVKRLRHERVCSCGQALATGAKYCPGCGKEYKESREIINIEAEPADRPDERYK